MKITKALADEIIANGGYRAGHSVMATKPPLVIAVVEYTHAETKEDIFGFILEGQDEKKLIRETAVLKKPKVVWRKEG